MRTARPLGVLLASAALLAGCAGPSGAPEGATTPGPDASALGLVLADLTSASCAYNDVIFVVPREHAQDLLPEGFTARPFLDDATSAIVMNVIHCEEGFGWSAADAFVVVEPLVPPAAMDAFDADNRTPRGADDPSRLELDIYMLAAYTAHGPLRELFEGAGLPVAHADVTKTSLPTPTGSAALGSVTDAQGDVLRYHVEGRPVGSYTASHRQWRETPDGLLLVERSIGADSAAEPVDLTQGPAECVVRPGTMLAQITRGVPCTLGQDTTNGFSWEGRAYLFPGTSGAVFQAERGAQERAPKS